MTRSCSETVVGRLAVKELGWTTAIELLVLTLFPLPVFALEDDESSSTEPRASGKPSEYVRNHIVNPTLMLDVKHVLRQPKYPSFDHVS